MKRAYAFLLALALVLTGCARKEKTMDVSVKDVSCPYEIVHAEDAVEITLCDSLQRQILWNVKTIPEGFCQVMEEETDEANTNRYRVTGLEQGGAQVIFTALQENSGTSAFVLTVVVDVDAEGKATVSDCQHRENTDTVVEENGLQYQCNEGVDGSLTFSFVNSEDDWDIVSDPESVFELYDKMTTPTSSMFTVRATEAGETTVELVGENTQRKILVVFRADTAGKTEVVSVQEQ